MNEASAYAQALAQSIGAQQAFKVAIVAAVHIQPSKAWVDALNYASKTATIIVVDDSNGKVVLPENWDVYAYDRQREMLGDAMYEAFEMFHKSSSCKTFGMWVAHQRGFDPIIMIDSDCIIPPDFVAKHLEALLTYGDGWENPLAGTGFYSRGFPMHERKKPVWAHMGLWENELDLYGTDRIGQTHIPKMPPYHDKTSAAGFVPLSGMNVSFRNDAIPYMLLLPNFKYTAVDGREYRFSRHDDIWGGYIFQKMAKFNGFAISYGNPNVYHDTVVIPEEDAAEEVAMIKYEKEFYQLVDAALNHIAFSSHRHSASDVYDCIAGLLEKHGSASAFYELLPAFELAADMYDDETSV